MATAVFAAGCFWGVEAFFERIEGVRATQVGYMGGTEPNPTYEVVKTGRTGHAEAIKIDYDSTIVGYSQLVNLFFECHDPTTINRQGEDIGSQYRSVIFYMDEIQKYIAEQKVTEWESKGVFTNRIITEITEAKPFFIAEEYHQKYLQKNGVVACGRV